VFYPREYKFLRGSRLADAEERWILAYVRDSPATNELSVSIIFPFQDWMIYCL